ncbi:MAG: hypothetical protein IT427_16350 [Pirellulales bacterium]|nr:hypothetical protein [Pirellulales bacterium]
MIVIVVAGALAITPFLLQQVPPDDTKPAHVEELNFEFRSFPPKIVYGDPIYIRLRVVNRGTSLVRAPPFDENNVAMTATDRELDVSTDCTVNPALFGEGVYRMHNYAPGRSRQYYLHVPLPKIDRLSHPFWTGVEARGSVLISCRSNIGRIVLNSDSGLTTITPRDPRELEALRRWSRLDAARKAEPDTKIFPFTVGISGLRDVQTREDAKELAATVQSGELGELLQLMLRLQQLERSANRERDSSATVEWVAQQPNIKRQWLAGRLSKLNWLFPETAVKSLKQLAEF